MGIILSFIRSLYKDESFWKELKSVDLQFTPNIQIPARLEAILHSLKNYQGCATYIKDAISKPSAENDSQTWKHLHPCVLEIRKYYEISHEIGIPFDLIIESDFYQIIKNVSASEIFTNFEPNRADLEKLAEFLTFYAEFDWLKVANPSLQNDFSYYRRSILKIKESKNSDIIIIPDAETNHMSLFLAQKTPMTTKVIQVLKNGIKKVCICLS
jgi:hypothetical protein